MPIEGVNQPEYINITEELRLHKYDGNYMQAMPWYEDKETLIMVDGDDSPYDGARLNKMYTYLNKKGEEYFIEVKINGEFRAIGDVTFWKEDMPIVIGDKSCRGKGIGKKIIAALIKRAIELGYNEIFVNEIYDFNIPSQRLFESCGFEAYEKTENGSRYRLKIK